jgi:hypothetical protein
LIRSERSLCSPVLWLRAYRVYRPGTTEPSGQEAQ